MNLSHHAKGITNPEWIGYAIATMGEEKFWEYVDELYKLLDGLKVGESVPILAWCQAENYDLFIKIATCYVSTSQCCYQFNPGYTIIKRNFDAREMEKTLALLARTRQEQIAGRNGNGAESIGKRSETISSSVPAV